MDEVLDANVAALRVQQLRQAFRQGRAAAAAVDPATVVPVAPLDVPRARPSPRASRSTAPGAPRSCTSSHHDGATFPTGQQQMQSAAPTAAAAQSTASISTAVSSGSSHHRRRPSGSSEHLLLVNHLDTPQAPTSTEPYVSMGSGSGSGRLSDQLVGKPARTAPRTSSSSQTVSIVAAATDDAVDSSSARRRVDGPGGAGLLATAGGGSSGGGGRSTGQDGFRVDSDGISAAVEAARVAALRQQWQEQQRRRRMLSRMEQLQGPADLQRAQLQGALLTGGWFGESSPGSSWEEHVRRAVASTDVSLSMGGAAAAAAGAQSPPASGALLYGYAERENGASATLTTSPLPRGTAVQPPVSYYPTDAAAPRDPRRSWRRRYTTAEDSNPQPFGAAGGDAGPGAPPSAPGPAAAASLTAAAVAAAAANLSTLLGLAASAFERARPASGPARRHPTPPPRTRPIFTPDPGLLSSNRLPVFVNMTNVESSTRKRQPSQPPHRTLTSTAAAAGPRFPRSASPAAAAAEPAGSGATRGIRGPPGTGAAAATAAAPIDGKEAGKDDHGDQQRRNESRAAEGAAGGRAGRSRGRGGGAAASVTSGPRVYDALKQVDVDFPDVDSVRPRAAAAGMGRSKRGLDEPIRPVDMRPSLDVRDALVHRRAPSASFGAPSHGKRESSPRKRSLTSDRAAAGGGAEVDAAQGAVGDVADETLPGYRRIRHPSRGAGRGGGEPSRRPSPQRPSTSGTQRVTGDADTATAAARATTAAAATAAAASRADPDGDIWQLNLAEAADAELGRGALAGAARSASPRAATASWDAATVYGGGGDVEYGLADAQVLPPVTWEESDVFSLARLDRSSSRSRSRSRSRGRSHGGGQRRPTGGAGADGGDGAADGGGGGGGGGGTWVGRGGAWEGSLVTSEPLRSAPAVAFGRAARFPTQLGEGEGPMAASRKSMSRRAEGSRAEGSGGEGEGAGARSQVGAAAAVTAAAAMAPLLLDCAYGAVLPRVTSAFISAASRRIDWLPRDVGAYPAQRKQRDKGKRRQEARVTAAGLGDADAGGEAGGEAARRRARSAPSEARQGQARRRSTGGVPRDEGRGETRPGRGRRDGLRPRRHRSDSAGRGGAGGVAGAAGGEAATSSDADLAGEGGARLKPGGESDADVDVDDEQERSMGEEGGEEDEDEGERGRALGRGEQRRRRRRRGSDQPPLEAMAPLENLAGAVAAVRPRVPAARFAHRSVAEGMRRDLQERRERQLQKALQLQQQLRNQTVEELWPASAAVAAAQLRRRERLQALSRRRRDDDGAGGDADDDERWSPLAAVAAAVAARGEEAAEVVMVIDRPSPVRAARRDVGSLEGGGQGGTATEPSEGDAGGVGPGSGFTARRDGPTLAAAAPATEELGVAVEGASPTADRRVAGRTLSPQRPPHFLAATHRALANLMPPPPPSPTDKSGSAPMPLQLSPQRGIAAAGWASDPAESLDPSYNLVEKRAPAISFSPLRQRPQPQPRYSREPGPGQYDPELADGALSRMTRTPAAVFGTAPRGVAADPYDSPTRGGTAAAAAAAAADIAWLDRDPGAALDFTRRRVPAALILPESTAPPRTAAADGVDDDDDGDGGPVPLVLDVRYTLVEPRVRGTPLMRRPEQAPVVQISDEEGPLERISGPADPWAIDLAIRPRRPAWGFPSAQGRMDLAQSPVGRYLLDLRPVYDLVERRVAGVPDFKRTPERNPGEAERLRELRRQPGIGEYDTEMAWSYLCRRAPQVLMRLAAPRWKGEAAAGPHDGDDDDDDETVVRQTRQALLELSQALDYIRPRPPAWTFAPVIRVVRRDGDLAFRGFGFGPLLSFDVNVALVRRRLPGALPFGAGPPRRPLLLDSAALESVRHLGPGYYEAELAWRAAQPVPREADFARGVGHQLDADEPPPPEDGGELPYGARLTLDAAAAKDVTLPRRGRGALRPMALALGREEALPVDPAYEGRTTHLPLPDPDLDLPTRHRVRNVVLDGGHGHQPLAPEPSLHAALRGPGAYFPADAEQALAVVGPAAPVVDFSRGPERRLLGSPGAAKEALEGNRLVLSPQTALDYIRPRAPAAVIQPPHADGVLPEEYLPYVHAVYDIEPGLELLLPRPAGPLRFSARPGRDPPLAWPAGIDPVVAPYSRTVGMLGPEDVALTQLAGFRRAPGAPDFARAPPRSPPERVDYDGQRLQDLDPAAALDRLRRQPPRPPNLALYRGHLDPTTVDGLDRDLTAWLDYRPRLDAVRPYLVAPLAVPLSRQIGREQALKGDPRVGGNPTGDLDAGAYRVRYRLVWRSTPAIDFGRAADAPRTGLPPGALPTDPDAGNVLLLEPRQPTGWQPRRHSRDSPTRQPFGRGEGRWERPGADPAYRFLAAVGDEGPALYLRYSADDLALLRRRATAANPPAAAWGWMTSRRDAQVMQPDPSQPPRPRLPSPAVSRVGTMLVQQLPPLSSELEVIKNNPPRDPRVVAIRRRDRVLQRMLDKIKAQRSALADI